MELTIEYKVETCCKLGCGLTWAMTSAFVSLRRSDHVTFYCPNGHPQYYSSESEAERIRRQKDELERKMQAQLNEARHAVLVANKAATKAKAEKRKVERRIAHGVCPCCNTGSRTSAIT